MIKKSFAVLTILSVLASSAFAIDPIKPHNLNTSTATQFDRLFGTAIGETDPTGDTYSSAPLVQDGASAFFISDIAPATVTFDAISENGGVNSASTDSTFAINEAFIPGVGPNGGDIIAVEYTALDIAGAPTAWVAAGVAGPAGPFTAWRLDVGGTAGGTDDIMNTDAILSSGFSIFDSAGGGLGTFGLTVDSSTAAGVSGLGVVGLGGADIAGFDLATIQLFWEVQPVPEPGSIALMLIGSLVGFGMCRRS
jgi:hypothetical protein